MDLRSRTIETASINNIRTLAMDAVEKAAEGGEPEAILLATGPEVAVAPEAHEALSEKGVDARVVSMPSWEVFDARDQGYKDPVPPPGVETRVPVEAGITSGWERYVGFKGASIGINRFGASAPVGVGA